MHERASLRPDNNYGFCNTPFKCLTVGLLYRNAAGHIQGRKIM